MRIGRHLEAKVETMHGISEEATNIKPLSLLASIRMFKEVKDRMR